MLSTTSRSLENETNVEIGDAFHTPDYPISLSKFPLICLQPERLNRTAFGGFAILRVIKRGLPSSEPRRSRTYERQARRRDCLLQPHMPLTRITHTRACR